MVSCEGLVTECEVHDALKQVGLNKPFAACHLIGPEQNYAVKGRSIQDNLHLVREILEGLKDDTEAMLINLDQSKAFDRVDHRF